MTVKENAVKARQNSRSITEQEIKKRLSPGYNQKRLPRMFQDLISPPYEELISYENFNEIYDKVSSLEALASAICFYMQRNKNKTKLEKAAYHKTKKNNSKDERVKKEATKLKEIFNAQYYEYLKQMPEIGWVWEFERRKDEYEKNYREAITRINSIESAVDKKNDLKLFVAIQDTLSIFPLRHNIHISFKRIGDEKDLEMYKDWPYKVYGPYIVPYPPDKELRYTDLPSFVKINFQSAIKAFSFPGLSMRDPSDCFYILNSVLLPDESNQDSTLYIGVNLKAKTGILIEVIRDSICKAKKELVNQEDTKLPPEWREYLKVYDLRKQKFSNKAIAAFLFKGIKSPDNKASRYFKEAVDLINNDGYRKYLLTEA
jgi:hypothetical protein